MLLTSLSQYQMSSSLIVYAGARKTNATHSVKPKSNIRVNSMAYAHKRLEFHGKEFFASTVAFSLSNMLTAVTTVTTELALVTLTH